MLSKYTVGPKFLDRIEKLIFSFIQKKGFGM